MIQFPLAYLPLEQIRELWTSLALQWISAGQGPLDIGHWTGQGGLLVQENYRGAWGETPARQEADRLQTFLSFFLTCPQDGPQGPSGEVQVSIHLDRGGGAFLGPVAASPCVICETLGDRREGFPSPKPQVSPQAAQRLCKPRQHRPR